jgi:hypothetical protein
MGLVPAPARKVDPPTLMQDLAETNMRGWVVGQASKGADGREIVGNVLRFAT